MDAEVASEKCWRLYAGTEYGSLMVLARRPSFFPFHLGKKGSKR